MTSAPTVSNVPAADERWQSAALPLDFVIIGAQKSASTFVQHCLAAHPEVHMPPGESPEFENPVYSAESMAALAASLDGFPAGRQLGIKRPNYLGSPEVPARLARHTPDARLIVVLRDPVARAVSAYRHYVTSGRVALMDIDTAFAGLLAGVADPRFPYAAEILDWGRYFQHLQRYQAHFAGEQLLVLLQHDVASTPVETFAQTCAFLGVDAGFRPPDLHDRRNIGAQSTTHLRFRRARTEARRKYLEDVTAARRPVVTRLTWPYVATLTAVDRYVFPHLPGRLDEPSSATTAALRDYYRDDVYALQDLLHRDLIRWT